MLFAGDTDWGEPVGEQPDLLVVEMWVWDRPQLHAGRQDFDEPAVVEAEGEVRVAEEEELALLDTPGRCSCFPTEGAVSRLWACAELADYVSRLPPRVAAPRLCS